MPVLTRKNELTNGKRNMRLGLQPSITKSLLINTMSLFASSEVNHLIFYTCRFAASYKVFWSLRDSNNVVSQWLLRCRSILKHLFNWGTKGLTLVLLLPTSVPPFPCSNIPANLHAKVVFQSGRSSTLWLFSSCLAEGSQDNDVLKAGQHVWSHVYGPSPEPWSPQNNYSPNLIGNLSSLSVLNVHLLHWG